MTAWSCIDTFSSDEAAGHLLQEIRKLTALPVKFVVNTHYHGDHVGGNKVFADAGARVLAHRNVRDWIHTENVRLLGDKPNPDLKTLIERFAPPTVTYTNAVDLHLGSRAMQVRGFPGHTGGDSVVIVPDAKVVFGGRPAVAQHDSEHGRWIDARRGFKRWIRLPARMPGTRSCRAMVRLASAQDVAAFRDYLATVQKLVADARATGKTGDAVVQAVMPA